MRAIVQRVENASVMIEGSTVASIEEGLLALVGFHHDDTADDSEYIISKMLNLRIFNDSDKVMNYSLLDCEKDLLVVPQFTLYGDARKGRRPSYSNAMPPEKARPFYDSFYELCKSRYHKVETGVFGANMKVKIINSGPVTILIDSEKQF